MQQLPGGFVLEDLFERLIFIERVEIERVETRLARPDRSKAVPFDEARARFQPVAEHHAS